MNTSKVQSSSTKPNGKRGSLSDLFTQKWVKLTGKFVTWEEYPWLEAPIGDVDVIGIDFFERFANCHELNITKEGAARGILDNFSALSGPSCDPACVNEEIIDFYENTSDYDFDVWSEWSGVFKPFGKLVALMFSRRLEQLNVPLSSLETRMGITSEVLKISGKDGGNLYSAWVRKIVATDRTLYAGSYQTCQVPGFTGLCIKVAFPLPNGFALVIMKPESRVDGSFIVNSTGSKFGDPGFYFFVEKDSGRGWAKYVASLKESITVYQDKESVLRADHELQLWGKTFLRLHYRMSRKRSEG